MRISAIVTDIEGTTTPIAFVRDTLFPYARERLRGYLRSHETDAEVQAICADIAVIAPGRPPEACLLEWMDADAKITPLKALQGKFGFSPEKVAEAAKDQLKLVAAGRNGKAVTAPK